MRLHRYAKRGLWGCVLLGTALLSSSTGLFQWSPINCWHYDVDILSGRVRYLRYLAFVPVYEQTRSSVVSDAFDVGGDAEGGATATHSEWKRVLTLSPGVGYSPNYHFGRALTQMRTLEHIWDDGRFTPDAKRASARRLLELWQRGDGCMAAQTYVDASWELASRNQDRGKATDAQDLPTIE